jgi:hypothetical protein
MGLSHSCAMKRPEPLVFINYRDQDEPWAAVVLDHALSQQFGTDLVFRDSKSVAAGELFDNAILAGLRHSAVLLVVIGERWLATEDRHGRRLIDRRQDWVRREIAEAFAAGLTVFPVLVGDVSRLDAAALPPSIRRLARCQYLRLRHRDFQGDLTELVRELQARLVVNRGRPISSRRTSRQAAGSRCR